MSGLTFFGGFILAAAVVSLISTAFYKLLRFIENLL